MRDWDKFMVLLPPGFRERVKELAKENGRSMNAEIVQRLKEVLKHEGKLA
ncbi:Arc family DNA-binding protein [Aeromonas caviae]|nr:Arc family DNA-binding protein [Aeromonas caviae]MDY7841587.1 Arc family DNA-binding protein [Aeromonas caviae]